MIKKLLCGCALIFYILLMMHCPGTSPDGPYDRANWQRRIGGTSNDYGYAIMTASSTVASGQINGNVDINDDGDTLDAGESAAEYGGNDILIAVFNTATGAHSWAERLGGAGNDFAYSIAANDSFIAVAGVIEGNVDLDGSGASGDAGAGSGEAQSAGFVETDAFVSVFNTSGVYQWSRRIGGNTYDSAISVAIDGSSNIIVTGYTNGNADLDGDLSVGEAGVPGEVPAAGLGNNDIFIISFSSSGGYNWSQRLGGSHVNGDYGNGLAVDSSFIVLAADVTGDAYLNSDSDTSDAGESATGFGGSDALVVALNASTGVYAWAVRIGSTINDIAYSVDLDGSHNVIVTGKIGSDAFIHKYDSSGTEQWSKTIIGAEIDTGWDVVADASGNIYAVGETVGASDLDAEGSIDAADSEETPATSVYGASDVFITSFNASGGHRWAERLGGLSSDKGYSIDIDASGNIIVSGVVNGNADLNGDGDFTDAGETSVNPNDIFIVSLKQ